MACNTPIIASFDTDSDLADVIRDSRAGVCIDPGNVDVLLGAIKVAYSEWGVGRQNSHSLREYVRLNASKEICVNRYIETIKSQCNR